MMTIREVKEWLDLMPEDTEIAIDEGGLSLIAPDYIDEDGDYCEMYLEVGGVHEEFDGTEGQDRESYTDTQDRENYTSR